MENLIDVLNKVLTEEIVVYKELLEILKKKTDILVNGDIKELDKLTTEEYEIINKLGKFENLREKVIFNIAHRKGIKDNLDVSMLLDLLEGKEKEYLANLRDELVDMLGKIKDRNDLNSTLIKDSLDYISLNLDLLTQKEDDLTYGNMNKKPQVRANIFNQKA